MIRPQTPDWLYQAELEQAEKIGPYSIMLPYSERKESVLKYFGPKDFTPEIVYLEQAFRQMAKLVRPNSLQLLDVDSAYNHMPKGTNLGLPYLSSRSVPDRKQVLAKARYWIEREYNDIQLGVYPAVLFWRGQPRGLTEVPKQRVVWGFPHDITILESRIQVPVLDALTQNPAFAAWVGQTAVDEEVTNILGTNKFPILSVDFSGFDASVPAKLIHLAFDLLRLWFNETAARDIDFIEQVFLNIPLITPEGVLYRVDGSVPSGSGVTNLIDSLVQGLAGWYAAYSNGITIDRMLVQGDDGVYSFNGSWEPEKIFKAFKDLGLQAGSDKGGISMDDVRFLQNLHHRNYRVNGLNVGVRPLLRILNGMMSYERMTPGWNQFLDSIRWYQQLESGKFHPGFSKAVELLYKHDKVSRRYGVREIIARSGGMDQAKSILREQSFPFGKYGLSGLMEFSTIKELQRLKASH
jgi:hypothetical protein